MWLRCFKFYYLMFLLQKRVDVTFNNDGGVYISTKRSILHYDFASNLEDLVEEMYRNIAKGGGFILFSSFLDKFNKTDLQFIRSILKKLGFPFSEDTIENEYFISIDFIP